MAYRVPKVCEAGTVRFSGKVRRSWMTSSESQRRWPAGASSVRSSHLQMSRAQNGDSTRQWNRRSDREGGWPRRSPAEEDEVEAIGKRTQASPPGGEGPGVGDAF